MENLFLKILNMSITAGWLILAILILRQVLRKAPKWISCLLWSLTAFRLICPVSPESIFSLIPSSETIHQDIVFSQRPAIDSGIVFVDNVVNPALGGSLAPVLGDSANPLQIWIFVASMVWAAGILVMLVYAAASCWRLQGRVRTAVRLHDSVYASEFVDTPFILGMIRPRIYLPSHMEETAMKQVIAHEKAHLERGDHLWKPLSYVLLTIYWFHPLCWAAYIMLCKDIELACDEKVIKSYDTQQRKVYSEALLACSLNKRTITACPLAFGEVGVKERVKSVLHYKKPALWIIAAAVAVCVAAAVCFLTDPVKKDAEDPAVLDDAGNNQNIANITDTDDTEDNRVNDLTDTTGISDSDLLAEALNAWKKAFVNHDGNTIAALASEELVADLKKRNLLYGYDEELVFGMSDSWPADETGDAVICRLDEKQAQINYYALAPNLYVTVWKETLTYELKDGYPVITGEDLIRMDNVSSSDEFFSSYLNGSIK